MMRVPSLTRRPQTARLVLLAAWLLILAACASADDDVFTGDEALAVSGDFIEAFNRGDADAVLALLTPDVALSETYSPGLSDSFEAIDRAFRGPPPSPGTHAGRDLGT